MLDRWLGVPLVVSLSPFARRGNVFRLRRLLVVNLNVIGDSVLQEPAFRALRDGFPSAEIHCICAPENAFLMQRYKDVWGYFDEVRVVRPSDVLNPLHLLQLLFWMRGQGFDAAIDFGQWTRLSALITLLSGAVVRVGFNTGKQHRHWAFNHPIRHTRWKHQRDAFCDLVEQLGVSVERALPRFPLTEADREEARHLLDEVGVRGDFIVIHPCAGKPTPKEWPLKRYAELARRLVRGNQIVVVTGAPTDMERIKEYDFGNALLLVGRTSLGGLAGVFEKAQVVVCNDSGTMHIACAVGTRVVALHGPTNPVLWGPLHPKAVVVRSDAFCSPCLYLGFDFGCRRPFCMLRINVDSVYKTLMIKLR